MKEQPSKPLNSQPLYGGYGVVISPRSYERGPMKRSEMVETIAEALLQSPHCFGGAPDEREQVRESSKMHRLVLAATALNACEAAGMLPPEFITTTYPYDDQGCTYFPTERQWAARYQCDICGNELEGVWCFCGNWICEACTKTGPHGCEEGRDEQTPP